MISIDPTILSAKSQEFTVSNPELYVNQFGQLILSEDNRVIFVTCMIEIMGCPGFSSEIKGVIEFNMN